MKMQSKLINRVLYVQLQGEVDEHNAAIARREADKLCESFALQVDKAVFDLKEVSFMDSTGIGFLLGRYKKFSKYGVPTYITNPTATADKILEMSGVYALMQKI